MAEIPEYFANVPQRVTQLPRAPSAQLADVGQGIEAQAIAGVGGAVFQIGQERKDVADDLSLATAINELNESVFNEQIALQKHQFTHPNDFAAAEKGFEKRRKLEVTRIAAGQNPAVAARLKEYGLNSEIRDRRFFHNIVFSKQQRFNVAELNRLWGEKFQQFIGNPTELKSELTTLIEQYRPWLNPSYAQRLFSSIDSEIAKYSIENLKPVLIAAIEKEGNKEAGYDILNAETKRFVEIGALTEAEAAEANKMLGDWIDNYAAGRIKQGKEAVKLTTRQSYQNLMPTLLDPALAQQRFGLVEESRLLKADKELWQTYIKGSYGDAPTENTPQGHLDATGAALDAATLQMSPKEAYDAVLTARFVDKTITDNQFKWAIDKIENPYPPHLVGDISATLNSNTKDFNAWYRPDAERNTRVNESLIAWVDEVIKRDKVPLFDFKKQMHAQSSQFRVGNDRWYDIGQIIYRGGWEWEVVGFDDDGEPIVEEITR